MQLMQPKKVIGLQLIRVMIQGVRKRTLHLMKKEEAEQPKRQTEPEEPIYQTEHSGTDSRAKK